MYLFTDLLSINSYEHYQITIAIMINFSLDLIHYKNKLSAPYSYMLYKQIIQPLVYTVMIASLIRIIMPIL
jgi:hypothetical protein